MATYTDLADLFVLNGEVIFVEDEAALYFNVLGLAWKKITEPGAVVVRTWGSGTSGPLGDGTTTAKSSPVSVIGGFIDWVQVSANGTHVIGLRDNGTVWTWGSNSGGQLGNNSTTSRSSPGSVVGGFTDWIYVAAGRNHTFGIRSNNTLWAWGNNTSGRLGDNTTAAKSSPVSVVGGFTDWIQATGGYSHSIGIRSNGTAWAWGSGGTGNLGNGSFGDFSSPVSVVGGFTDWTRVSAGSGHSVGLRANGTVWSWGYNVQGQLGINAAGARNSPTSVVGGFTNWVFVDTSGNHTIGLLADGTAWTWGVNAAGQLGDGTTTSRSSPVSVVGGFTDWVQATAGFQHSIAVRANSNAWAWGNNGAGRLGDGTTVGKSSPVSVVGGITNWIEVHGADTNSAGLTV